MASKTLEEIKRRQQVIDNLGIKFPPDIEPKKWPESHQMTFEHIQTLGGTLYKSWEKEVCVNWQDAPWKYDMGERARRLCDRARDCRDLEVREREWRSRLEPSIFHRFENDVTWYVL
jgi:hypothetical protein